MIIIKVLRRIIIVLCLILLGGNAGVTLCKGYSLDKYYENLAEESGAEVLDINASMKIDGKKILFNSIFSDDENIYIGYKYTSYMNGDYFGTYAIRVFDDSGKEYFGRADDTVGIIGGEKGVIRLTNIIPEDTEYLTLKLDNYDRKDEVKIWLKEEGRANEN